MVDWVLVWLVVLHILSLLHEILVLLMDQLHVLLLDLLVFIVYLVVRVR